MSWKPVVACLMLLLATLAGCSDGGDSKHETDGDPTACPDCETTTTTGSPPPGDEGPAGNASAPLISTLEIQDCINVPTGTYARQELVQAYLPEGYGAVEVAADVSAVDFALLDCGGAVVDGSQVVEAFSMAVMHAGVVPPTDVQSDHAPDEYLLELLASDPLIVEAFRARGFVAELGRVDIELSEAQATVEVEAGDSLYITGERVNVFELWGPGRQDWRLHQMPGSTPLWIDWNTTFELASPPLDPPSLDQIHGGLLLEMTEGRPATMGIGRVSRSDATFDF